MDEWGKDPAVQVMRSIFKEMEVFLEDILERLAISPYDPRMRRWLEKALEKFERSWGMAHQMGISMDEEMAPAVYARCFAKVLGSEEIEVPQVLLLQVKEAERLVNEVFK